MLSASYVLLTCYCTRAGHSLVTGVLLQWLVVSRAFTLAQGMLTRRLITAIQEDIRHSRLGYEAFFKRTSADIDCLDSSSLQDSI